MIRCPKSAQKSAVQVCQVATVVMETTQLVLSQFKTFYMVCMCQSERCKLVKLRHINCRGTVFWGTIN